MIIFDKKQLKIDNYKLDLSQHPKKYELLRELYVHFERSRDELISEVYKIPLYPNVSIRLWESTKQKINKLISRSRKQLKLHIGDDTYDWLPYDKNSKTWKFFEKKNPHR